jgi:hypothetical protein
MFTFLVDESVEVDWVFITSESRFLDGGERVLICEEDILLEQQGASGKGDLMIDIEGYDVALPQEQDNVLVEVRILTTHAQLLTIDNSNQNPPPSIGSNRHLIWKGCVVNCC